MARPLPDPNMLYDVGEVMAMFGYNEQKTLVAHVNDGRFPAPTQQGREGPMQWAGAVLLKWIDVLPMLRRPGGKIIEKVSDELGGTEAEPGGTQPNRRGTRRNPAEPAQDE